MNNNLYKLEYNKILEIVSSYCKTYIGKDYVLRLRPSKNQDEVTQMLNETNQGVILIQRNNQPPLDYIEDINVYIKTLESSGVLNIKALLAIQKILQMSHNLKDYLKKDFLSTSDFSDLELYFNNLYTNVNIVSTFTKSIIDESTIADIASTKLQDIRRQKRKIEQE